MDGIQKSDLTKEVHILEDIIDNLPVALFAKDAADDYRFVLWNKKQEQVTTIPRERALGKNDRNLFSTESAKYFREVDVAVMKKGKIVEIPEEILDTGAGEIYLRTIKIPIFREERSILVGISEDITEKVRGKEQLKKLSDNLSEKNRELELTQQQLFQAEKLESIGRLAAGVAHEVKNPLGLLLMGVEYLSDGITPGDPNIVKILKEMREAIERADKIVRGLLDFSGDRQIHREITNPVDLCERVLVLTRHELTRNSVTVEKCYRCDDARIKVDQGKFEQVLINIFMNAIHAMAKTEECPDNGTIRQSDNQTVPPSPDYETMRPSDNQTVSPSHGLPVSLSRAGVGRPLPRMKITIWTDSLTGVERNEGARTAAHFRKGDKVVIFQIEDNGRGIKEEDLPRVFDPFFTTKATGVGTGLGLSVVRKIVELHQGRITLQNRPGNQGALVQIILPAAGYFSEFD